MAPAPAASRARADEKAMLRPFDPRTKLEYAILSALEQRVPGHGCERVAVIGYAQDEVDQLLRALVESDFVHARWIDGEPGRYVPSELSQYGHARLRVLRR
jgi:hypothetical protein